LYSSFGQQQQSLRRLLTNNFSDKIINQNFISRSSSDFYLLPSLSIAYLNFYGFCAFFYDFSLVHKLKIAPRAACTRFAGDCSAIKTVCSAGACCRGSKESCWP